MLGSFGSAACREKVYILNAKPKFSYKNQHNIFIFSKQKLFLFRRLNIDLKILVQFKNKNIKNVCVYLFKLWIYWYEHRNIFFGMFDVHKTWKYILLVFDIWRFIWRQVFIGLHLNFMNIEYHFFGDVMKLYITMYWISIFQYCHNSYMEYNT